MSDRKITIELTDRQHQLLFDLVGDKIEGIKTAISSWGMIFPSIKESERLSDQEIEKATSILKETLTEYEELRKDIR